MLALFRRMLSNRIVLVVLAIVLLAFLITGIEKPFFGQSGPISGGSAVVTVGDRRLTAADLQRRVQQAFGNARDQDQALTLASFVAQGGFEAVVDQMVGDLALEQYARKLGMVPSRKLIDGEIASVPAFAGPDGKFDQRTMDAVLGQRGLNAKQLRDDVATGVLDSQLRFPAGAAALAQPALVVPYAGLLLEERDAAVGIVPAAAFAPKVPPAPAAVEAFYRAHIDRFTVAERRSLRYAAFGRERIMAAATPTDAEVQAAYARQRDKYGAKNSRSFQQVLLPDAAQARAFAARVRGGDFDAAAAAAGFARTDTALGELGQTELAGRANAAVAAAAFAARQGEIVGPIRTPLGYSIVKVLSVTPRAATPLAQVRSAIATELQMAREKQLFSDLVGRVQDALDGGDDFDAIVRRERLEVTLTPPILQNGSDPDQSQWRGGPDLPALLRAAFATSPDERPTLEQVVPNERFALFGITRVVPPTPRPLAQIRPLVTAVMVSEQSSARARAVADAIMTKVRAGQPLTQAFATAGMPLPVPSPVHVRQIDLARQQGPVPLAVRLIFGMRSGDVKTLQAPRGEGWFVVQLRGIQSKDPRTQPGLVETTQTQIARLIPEEYARQFATAAANVVGVRRDEAGLARLKAQLAGSASQ